MSMEANLWTAKKNSVEVLGHSLLSTLKSAVVVSPSGVIAVGDAVETSILPHVIHVSIDAPKVVLMAH